jgi:hypothetical protein
MTTTTDTPTLDQVLTMAKRLPPIDQVRLIEHLAPHIEHALASSPAAPPAANDAWERLARLREELAALPADRSAGEQLDADRAERQAMIEGSERVHD